MWNKTIIPLIEKYTSFEADRNQQAGCFKAMSDVASFRTTAKTCCMIVAAAKMGCYAVQCSSCNLQPFEF